VARHDEQGIFVRAVSTRLLKYPQADLLFQINREVGQPAFRKAGAKVNKMMSATKVSFLRRVGLTLGSFKRRKMMLHDIDNKRVS
jgi:hypothetical protein